MENQTKKTTKEDVIKNIKAELRNQQKNKVKAQFIKIAFKCLGIFVAIVVIVGVVLRYFFPKLLTDNVNGVFLVCIGVSVISVVLILLISEVYADSKGKRFPAFETGSKEVKKYLEETIADTEKELAEVKEDLNLLYEVQEYLQEQTGF